MRRGTPPSQAVRADSLPNRRRLLIGKAPRGLSQPFQERRLDRRRSEHACMIAACRYASFSCIGPSAFALSKEKSRTPDKTEPTAVEIKNGMM